MLDRKNANASGAAAVFVAIFLWGVLPLYWKQLSRVPADQILANRIVWSFVFILVILLFQGRLRELFSQLKSRQGLLLCASGFILSLNWFTYIYAVNSNHIIEASLGYYINPLLTILLGRVVLKEKLDYLQLGAVLLAAIGVGIMTFSYGRVPLISVILALTFGIYSLVKKRVNTQVVVGLGIETLAVLPIALIYLWVCASKQQLAYPNLSLVELLFVVGTGIITVIPLMLFAYGARRIPLTTVGFIQYMSPTLSLFLGIFLYEEPFTVTHLFTFGFIWVALLLYSFSQYRHFSEHKGLKGEVV